MRDALKALAALLLCAPAWAVSLVELPNGARLVAIQSPTLYASAIAVIVDSDAADEGELHGLRSLLARTSLAGVEGMDPRQVLERLQTISAGGGQVTSFADEDAMVLGVSGPPSIEPLAVAILGDALLRPGFSQPALDAATREAVSEAEDQASDRFYGLLRRVRSVLHPAMPATSPVGTVGGLRATTVDDLRSAHASLVVGNRVICVGISPGPELAMLDQLRSLVRSLPAGEKRPAPSPTWDPASPLWKAQVTEDREGRLALMLMAFAVPNMGSDAWPATELACEILGGPAGRLTRSPRLRQYAPTVDVFLIPRARYSQLVVLAATPMAWRIESLRLEVLGALEELAAESPPASEVAAARRRLLGEHALRHRSALSRAIEVGRIALANGSVEAAAHAPLEGLRRTAAEDIRSVARTYLGPEDAALGVTLPISPPLDQVPDPGPSAPVAEGL